MRLDNFKFTDEEMQKLWKRLTEISEDYIKLDLSFKELEKNYRELKENIHNIINSDLTNINKLKEIGKVTNETK